MGNVGKGGHRTPTLRPFVWITILTAGIVLRLLGLQAESLWLDEGFSIHLATTPHFWTELQKDSNPPGFFLLLRAWLAGTSLDAGTLRLLPALLSIAALLTFADAARRLPLQPFGPTVALVLYATSPFLCWYAWELRPYSMLELGSVLMLNGVTRQTQVRTALGGTALGVGALIACMAHYFGTLSCLAAAGLLLVWSARRPRVTGLLVLSGAVGLCAAAYGLLLPHQFDTSWGAQSHASLGYLATLPVRLFLVNSRLLPTWVVGIVGGVVAMLGLASVVVAARDRASGASRLWWGSILAGALPIAAALLGSLVVEPRFTARYFIMVPAQLCIVLGIGSTLFGRRASAATAVVAGAVFFVVTCLSTQLNSKDGYREACASIAERWRPGDLVGVMTGMPSGFNIGPLRAYLPERIVESAATEAFEVGRPGPDAGWERAHLLVRWMPYTEKAIRDLLDRHQVTYRSGAVRNVEHVIVQPVE